MQVPSVGNQDLNTLFASAWQRHEARDFAPILARSLTYFCVYAGERLIGFINLAWDGGSHAFLLNTTVHPDYQGTGIGKGLVRRAIRAAEEQGVEWVHVDYKPHLREFYAVCGFQMTEAGLIHCRPTAS